MQVNTTSVLFSLAFSILPYIASCSVADMTVEEKVGQMLMVHFNGEVANADAEELIQQVHVGGILYFNWANGLHSPEQVRALSASLQKAAEMTRTALPLFIAVDQEGGLVARLSSGFTVFPGNAALGMTGDPALAEKSAFAMGQEMRAVGVNMNLAPVVDINSNPRNPVIGIRSFADTAAGVTLFAKSALSGYHQAGIITTLKHFPGHGDVDVDSHVDLPVVAKSLPELEKFELAPFAALAGDADAIMTGHILATGLDSTYCTTLSKKSLSYLKNEIGFKGVIVSDSLVMQGLLTTCPSIDEAACRAIEAGCDLLILAGKQLIGGHSKVELKPSDIKRIHGALVKAVQSGRISEEQVSASVQKILDLKKRYILQEQNVCGGEHQKLAKEIATLALKTVTNKPLPPLGECRVVFFAPALTQSCINQTTFATLGKETAPFFYAGLNPTQEEIEQAQELANKADVLIFCSYNAWKNSEQQTLAKVLADTGKPMIVIVVRDPQDSALYPEAHRIFTTFSPTAPSIQAVCDCLIN